MSTSATLASVAAERESPRDGAMPFSASELCERYAARVYHFATMVAGSDLEAEDLAQSALERALRALPRFDGQKGHVEAWLWRIVVNVARDAGRAAARRQRLWERLVQLRPGWTGNDDILRISNERLVEAIRTLTPRQRSARVTLWRRSRLRGCGGRAGNLIWRRCSRYTPGPDGFAAEAAGGQSMTESQLSESLSDRLAALKSPPPDGLIARARTAVDAPAPHVLRTLTSSLANFDPPVNSPRRRGLNLIAGVAGFAVVAAGLGVFALDVSGRLHSPVAPSAAKAASHKSTPGAPWVVQEFHGDGLVVTLDHPAPWHSQSAAAEHSYAGCFGYLANYPLQPFCTHPSATSFECSWANVGKFPWMAYWSASVLAGMA